MYATIASNWGGVQGQFHFGLSGSDPNGHANLSLSVMQTNGRFVQFGEGEAHPFPLYEWQHVAFTTDGSTARIYRQGREVVSFKHAGLQFPVASKGLGIGVSTDALDKSPAAAYPNFWDGKLDEVAVFNDALTAEDIKKLAASAPR